MSIKQDRVAGRIQTILSQLLHREVSDPRLQNVTITAVEIDQELQYARVYVNALGDEDRQPDVMQGLARASKFLRREVGSRVRLRQTPELHFYWDESLAYGDHMDRVLGSLDIPPEEPDETTDE